MEKWIQLADTTTLHSEATLQSIFDLWMHGRSGWKIAALPAWLMCDKIVPPPRKFKARNYLAYSYMPDAIWHGKQCFVIELKRANKYEPLGLAEVLHHAWCLGQRYEYSQAPLSRPIPVLICSSIDGTWERGALQYLFAGGFKKESIRYLQATYLESPHGFKYLWLDEPFAHWVEADVSRIPTFIRGIIPTEGIRVYFSPDSGSIQIIRYQMTDHSVPPEYPHLHISPADDGSILIYYRSSTDAFWAVSEGRSVSDPVPRRFEL